MDRLQAVKRERASLSTCENRKMSEVITPQFLKTVIEESGRHGNKEVRVCWFKPTRVGANRVENYASSAFRCPVVYVVADDDDEKSVLGALTHGDQWCLEERRVDLFIKLMPAGRERADNLEELGAFRREAEVYDGLLTDMRHLVDRLEAPKNCYPDTAVCLYTKGTGPDPAVVMEDLSFYGYREGNRREGVTEEEARFALRAFAKYHANGIAVARLIGSGYEVKYPHLEPCPFEGESLKTLMSDNNRDFRVLEQALRKVPGHEARADRLKAYLDNKCPVSRQKYIEFRKYLKNTGHKLDGYCLGDSWVNNMLFRDEIQPDGSSKIAAIKLLDLQLVEPATPFPDLYYFLGSSTTRELRAKTRDLLRDEYFAELVRVLSLLGTDLAAEGYTFDNFWTDFLGGREYMLVAAMYLLPVVLARNEDLDAKDVTQDLTSVDDFNRILESIILRRTWSKVLDRFADLVQDLMDQDVI